MPTWNTVYYETLVESLSGITESLNDRLETVVDGREAPAVEDIAIGSARRLRAAILFFDIRGFTGRTNTSNLSSLREALQMLDCVVPMIQ
jgi:class 3 adenylate cyclase